MYLVISSSNIVVIIVVISSNRVYLVKFLRAAFKFGRRVQFAPRRKMLNPPMARLPAI